MKKVKLFFKYETSEYKKGSVHEVDAKHVSKYVGQGALIATKEHEQKKVSKVIEKIAEKPMEKIVEKPVEKIVESKFNKQLN